MTPQENYRISHSSNRMCQNAHLLLSIMNELIHFLSMLNAFHFFPLIESLLVFHLQKLDFNHKRSKILYRIFAKQQGVCTLECRNTDQLLLLFILYINAATW